MASELEGRLIGHVSENPRYLTKSHKHRSPDPFTRVMPELPVIPPSRNTTSNDFHISPAECPKGDGHNIPLSVDEMEGCGR